MTTPPKPPTPPTPSTAPSVSQRPALEIPHALQAEIFDLETAQRFRFEIDSMGTVNQIQLICHCEDKLLPAVPPINVTIPPAYPYESPTCSLPAADYLGTEFFRKVYANMMTRIKLLPRLYSLTRLMEAWEISVRQTFSPNPTAVADLSEFFGL